MANAYVNAKVDLTTTDVTTLYTCGPFATAIIKSILVSIIVSLLIKNSNNKNKN